MADEDEDLSHLRAPNPADVDLTDEVQDWRFLGNLNSKDPSNLTLPKRGEKDFEPHATNRQSNALEESRQAMRNALSGSRVHPPKQHLLGHYHTESNMVYVHKVNNKMFTSMGHFKGGKEWLFPEEALFLLERGSLDCRWPAEQANHDEGEEKDGEEKDEEKEKEFGVPMSLQGAYAAFIGFEGGVGGKLTLEMYSVYASLKRAGYVVLRTGSWDDDRAPLLPPPADTPSKAQQTSHKQSWLTSILFSLLDRRFIREDEVPSERLHSGSLLAPGLYRSWPSAYRLLSLVPTHDRSVSPEFILPPSTPNPFRIHFDIYKPNASFKKTRRGPPDYRVCVVNARETSLPTMAELNDLLATTPYAPPKENEQLYQKLRFGSRNVVLAVVDNGIPSFIRIADAAFNDERLYERVGRGPKRKGGGKRGGGKQKR